VKLNFSFISRWLLPASLLVFSANYLEAQQIPKGLTASNGQFIGFYEFKPYNYNSTSNKHPLIVFLHGVGERGNGTTELGRVLANAIPKYCANGATMTFTHNGQQESFMVLSPQLSTSYGQWEPFHVEEMIKYAKQNLRVDTNRIYLCGLSLGGGGTWKYATTSAAFAKGLAAIAPVCATNESVTYCHIAQQNLPVWAFHAEDDGTVGVGNTRYVINQINNCNPGVPPKATYYPDGGHGIWDRAFDMGHTWQSPVNVYEWFLSNTRATGQPPGNQPPVANAGADVVIALPATTATLNGAGSYDPNGSITAYAWTQLSGPSPSVISNATGSTTSISGLAQGSYTFKLTVTDNSGATGEDQVVVTVNPAVNQAPVAKAGPDISITLPVNNTSLNGSASFDSDGTISFFGWSKLAGPASFSIDNPYGSVTALNNLVQGTYSFLLVVTDNNGAIGKDTVVVNVNGAPPPPNQPPNANAGSDISITLPVNGTTLTGTASSDPDGSISNYSWTKLTGPASSNINDPTSVNTAVSNLVQGLYSFRLLVTDNNGATDSDTVMVTVNAAPPPVNQIPIANAGADISITLPINNTTLNGTGSNDPDGSISNFAWSKISGPTQFAIANSSNASTSLTNLIQGTYSFRLVVIDNAGASDDDTVMVTVNAAPNQLPIANAGSDITITLPVNSVTVNGTASSDPDGSIAGFMWTKLSGPPQYAIATPTGPTTSIDNMVQGVYSFQLVVTDNNGAIDRDTVTVTVGSAPPPPNVVPIASAGADIGITLPVNSTTLIGSGSNDPDGTIVQYAWSKISGPAQFSIVNASSATTPINNMAQGVYSFRLVVTDNAGATDDDTVLVTISPAPNQSPVANAGSDINITLPATSATLNGSASGDPDGTLVNYVWTKLTGPTQYTIADPSLVNTAVTNLVQGTYSFRLQVTDNSGASSADTVFVNVNAVAPPVNQLPVAKAGTDIAITLPVNTTTLNGTASFDPDGTISYYGWSRLTGPTQFTIANAFGSSTALSNLVQGTYSFLLVVTDNNGDIGKDTVVVTVNAAPNQLPAANAGADISITLPVSSTTLSGAASSDPDGSITAYAWSKISGPAQYTLASPADANTALTNLVQGTYLFRVFVTDNSGASDADTVMVVVNGAPPPPNQPPVANAGADISITLPVNNAVLNGSASLDPDGTIAGYIWSKIAGPGQYAISNPTSSSTVVNNLVQGTYSFRLLITDNSGATDADTVVVVVNAAPPPPNQPPVANAGVDISITLPVNNTILDGAASSDPDGNISTYLWSKISGPAQYAIDAPASVTTSLSSLIQGVYSFRLTVTDSNGASDFDTLVVTVNAAAPPPNQPPVANAGTDISITLPVNNTTLSGNSSSDPDGYIINHAWSAISGPAQYTIGSPNGVTTSVTNLAQGVYWFRLVVTDNSGATNADTVVVTVNAAPPPPNQLPVANAGADVSIILPGGNANLNGSGSFDPDGSITNYLWTKLTGPAQYTITNSSAVNTSVTNLAQGTYSFRLTVTDNNGATDADTMWIVVNAAPPPPNQPPLANAGTDITVQLPINTAVLDGAGSADPDGAIVAYAWTKSSGPSQYAIVNTNSTSTVVNNMVQGVYVFKLTVTDNNGAIDTDSVVVTVNAALPVNQLPIANAGADIIIELPANDATLTGLGSFDPDGIIANFAWSKVSGPGQYNITNAGIAVTQVTGLAPGDYIFKLVVTDNTGATSEDQVMVRVITPLNQAPVANAGKDTTINLPANSLTLDGRASKDPDGVSLSYQWTQVSGPSLALIFSDKTAVTKVSDLQEGDYEFELRVVDAGGATAAAKVKVKVTNNFRFSQFLRLSPTPASSMLNFVFIDDTRGKINICILDAMGNVLWSRDMQKDQSQIAAPINVSSLKPGLFYLRIVQPDGKKLVRAFIKQ
jgi:poly(3-hydroxybutyrate) depolymerase